MTLAVMLGASLRCPDCLTTSVETLLRPPSAALLTAGGALLGARFAAGWLLDRLLPAYRAYVDQVHYPDMRARLQARGIPLALWVTLAGVLEELAYRGLLLPVFGLLPSSLLFGVTHLAPVFRGERREWPHALASFLSALLYGGATLITGSLWPSVLAHAAGNGFLSFQLLWQYRRRSQEGTGISPNSLS